MYSAAHKQLPMENCELPLSLRLRPWRASALLHAYIALMVNAIELNRGCIHGHTSD
jgi:hypothetical protein